MELKEVVSKRQSIRRFKDTEISDKDIIELVDNFEDIIDKYDMYDNYRTIEDWAEDNNKICNFIVIWLH